MSGIGGIMLRVGSPSDPLLFSMAQSLKHRGPDAMKGEIYEQVGFVHTGLSASELDGKGYPLHRENLALIASGALYNYTELCEAFSEHSCETKIDFEAALLLYLQYGPQFVDHLRGMYALALYDDTSKTLLLSRDPFGIKPLYYWEGTSGVAFASEPQALLKAGLLSPSLNQGKVCGLLSLNYMWGRETLYKGIQRVMPGETIIIKKGRIVERFLRPALPKGPPQNISLEEGLSVFDKTLDQSVGVHLRSDAPLGLFLSENLNSACLLKLMSRHSKAPVRTFSIKLPGKEDQKNPILDLTTGLMTTHEEVTFDEKDFWTLLPQLMFSLDDPTLDMSALFLYKIGKKAAKSVKVLLSSEGGKEIFGGYDRYNRAKRPWWLGGALVNYDEPLLKLGILHSPCGPIWRERDEFIPVLKEQNFSRLQIAQAIDFEAFVPNDLLLKLDRCLLAHGVEGRTPFLDTSVAESLFNFPDDFKIKQGIKEWLLQEWIQKNFPEGSSLVKPQNFTSFVSSWILSRGKDIGFLVSRQEGIRQICYTTPVQNLFLSANKKAQRVCWSLLCFALWHQIHILKVPPQEDAFVTLGKPLG